MSTRLPSARLKSNEAVTVIEGWHATSSMEVARRILADGFRPGRKGWFGPGIYLSTDEQSAAQYANRGPVLRVTAALRRPLIGTDHDGPTTAFRDAVSKLSPGLYPDLPQWEVPNVQGKALGKAARADGYDSILIRERSNEAGGNQAVVFGPKSITSVRMTTTEEMARLMRLFRTWDPRSRTNPPDRGGGPSSARRLRRAIDAVRGM